MSVGNSSSSGVAESPKPSSNVRSMKPVYSQTLQTPNVKVMCIAAIGESALQSRYVL